MENEANFQIISFFTALISTIFRWGEGGYHEKLALPSVTLFSNHRFFYCSHFHHSSMGGEGGGHELCFANHRHQRPLIPGEGTGNHMMN